MFITSSRTPAQDLRGWLQAELPEFVVRGQRADPAWIDARTRLDLEPVKSWP